MAHPAAKGALITFPFISNLRISLMAKVKYSALVTGMANSLNGSTLQRCRYGSMLRIKSQVRRVPVGAALTYQTFLPLAITKWKSLTAAQLNLFEMQKLRYPTIDTFGDEYLKSTYLFFLKCQFAYWLNHKSFLTAFSEAGVMPAPPIMIGIDGIMDGVILGIWDTSQYPSSALLVVYVRWDQVTLSEEPEEVPAMPWRILGSYTKSEWDDGIDTPSWFPVEQSSTWLNGFYLKGYIFDPTVCLYSSIGLMFNNHFS